MNLGNLSRTNDTHDDVYTRANVTPGMLQKKGLRALNVEGVR